MRMKVSEKMFNKYLHVKYLLPTFAIAKTKWFVG